MRRKEEEEEEVVDEEKRRKCTHGQQHAVGSEALCSSKGQQQGGRWRWMTATARNSMLPVHGEEGSHLQALTEAVTFYFLFLNGLDQTF